MSDSTSKAALDDLDLDNLPDACTPPQGSRKRTLEEQTTSELRLERYDDDFCGDSFWLHVDLNSRDTNGRFKPTFSGGGKISGDSYMTKVLEDAGCKLRLPGYCMCFMKLKETQGFWGTHRARVIGKEHALTIANICRPHLQAREQMRRLSCALC